MTSYKEEIEKISQDYLNGFRVETQSQYREIVEREYNLKKQYEKRELFELLQNIDDALKENKSENGVASCILNHNELIVCNNGSPFTLKTFQSLCQGNVSRKNNDYIGNKGIGFRAVLNWTDHIEIYSGWGKEYISAEFSRENADLQFKKLMGDKNIKPHIEDQINKLAEKDIPSKYPIMKAPRFINPIEKDFDTVIKFKLTDSAYNNIKNSILEFDANSILFLPYINKIEFLIEADDLNEAIKKEIYKKGPDEKGIISVHSDNEVKKYYFKEKETELKEAYEGSKRVKLGVAIPMDFRKERDFKLFTFFPLLDASSPFEAILNATFCVTKNRNELDNSTIETKGVNREIFKLLLDFYVETVIEFIEGQDRLKYLCPVVPHSTTANIFKFPGVLENVCNAENEYFPLLKNKLIFYTQNGTYKSPDDNGLIIVKKTLEWFEGKIFDSLISNFQELIWFEFANKIAKPTNTEKLLCDIINKAVEKNHWSTEQRIATFKWWNEAKLPGLTTLLPALLKDINGDFIRNQEEAVFLKGSIMDVPDWATIKVLHPEDTGQLLHVYKEEIRIYQENNPTRKGSSYRFLENVIKFNHEIVNIQEQSSKRDLISPVNNAVGDNYDRACDFIEWLYKVWSNLQLDTPEEDTVPEETPKFKESVKEISFNFPAQDRSVERSSNLYIGNRELNPKGYELLHNIPEYKKIFLGERFLERDKTEVRNFLSEVGVRDFPAIRDLEHSKAHISEYDRLIREYVSQSVFKEKKEYEGDEYEINVEYIDHLDKILTSLSSIEILKWIFYDINLYRRLTESEFEPNNSYVKYRPSIKGKTKTVDLISRGNIPSFLLFVFSSFPWMEINGKKYSPDNVIFPKNKYEILDSLEVPWLSEAVVNEWADRIGVKTEKLSLLLYTLGVKRSFIDLPESKFYKLLSDISKLDNEIQISRSVPLSKAIYNEIISKNYDGENKERLIKGVDIPEKEEYRNYGKVLAKSFNEKTAYYPLKEVRFSSSAVIKPKNIALLDVPPRRGDREIIKSILCIEPFDRDEVTVIKYEKSRADKAFQSDFTDFMAYFLTFYEGSKENSLINLRIFLSDSMELSVKDENSIVVPYSPIKIQEESNNWIIFVENLMYEELDRVRLGEAIKRIINVVLNFPSQEIQATIQLLINFNKIQRKTWAETYFGSEDDVEKYRHKLLKQEELQEKILELIKQNGYDVSKFVTKIDAIDWINLGNAKTQSGIIELINEKVVTLKEISEILETTLSFREYNIRNIEKMMEKYRDYFENRIYNFLIEKRSQRKDFQKFRESYNIHELIKISNLDYNQGIDIDFEKITINFINNNFPEGEREQEKPYFKKVYENNLKRIQDYLGEDLTKRFLRDISKDSLMYFEDEMPALMKDAEKMKEDEDKIIEEDNKKEENDDFMRILGSSSLGFELIPSNAKKPEGHRGAGGGAVSEVQEERKNKTKNQQGKYAEKLVISYLEEGKFPEIIDFLKEDDYLIRWVSGNSLTPHDQNSRWERAERPGDSYGYDIEVSNKEKTKKIYIEVKSSSDNACEFMMSENEYSKMEEVEREEDHLYRVIFVGGLNIKDPESKPSLHYLDYSLNDSGVFGKTPLQYRFNYKSN